MPYSDPFARRGAFKLRGNDAFQDPLEHEEWRGLDWLTPLLARLVRIGSTKATEPARKARRLDVRVQTRSPFFTR
jgi:hypothetical protein